MKCKTVRQLEKKNRKSLQPRSRKSLRPDTKKIMSIKRKTDQWDFIKFKFLFCKRFCEDKKKIALDMFLQRKYLQATYMIPRISRIYKEFSKLSNKIGKNPIRRWPKGMKMLLKMAKNTWKDVQYYLSLFSRLTVSDSVQLHGLQHARPLCPSSSPKVCPSSCPLHQWCHPVVSSSEALFSFCPHCLPSIRDFSKESAVHIRWPKY